MPSFGQLRCRCRLLSGLCVRCGERSVAFSNEALHIGGMPDHIHILAKLSPKLAIMDVLRDIKAVSSKWVNDRQLVRGRFEWQTGYGAFSVSQSQFDVVRTYIHNQEQHHRKTPFKSEFITLLERHQIEYDPKYVFEEEHIA